MSIYEYVPKPYMYTDIPLHAQIDRRLLYTQLNIGSDLNGWSVLPDSGFWICVPLPSTDNTIVHVLVFTY